MQAQLALNPWMAQEPCIRSELQLCKTNKRQCFLLH